MLGHTGTVLQCVMSFFPDLPTLAQRYKSNISNLADGDRHPHKRGLTPSAFLGIVIDFLIVASEGLLQRNRPD
jgi:hypothetical protein